MLCVKFNFAFRCGRLVETLDFWWIRSGRALIVSLSRGVFAVVPTADHPTRTLTLTLTGTVWGEPCLDAGEGAQSITCAPGAQLGLVQYTPLYRWNLIPYAVYSLYVYPSTQGRSSHWSSSQGVRILSLIHI